MEGDGKESVLGGGVAAEDGGGGERVKAPCKRHPQYADDSPASCEDSAMLQLSASFSEEADSRHWHSLWEERKGLRKHIFGHPSRRTDPALRAYKNVRRQEWQIGSVRRDRRKAAWYNLLQDQPIAAISNDKPFKKNWRRVLFAVQ